ncbi:hypothetical protein RHEC894_CH02890 [Rhizobium sp. CIAT894]|nr:hypothetical protein RHEC894_CH02890 [Rhizobium sp. CIAT894]
MKREGGYAALGRLPAQAMREFGDGGLAKLHSKEQTACRMIHDRAAHPPLLPHSCARHRNPATRASAR